MEILRFIALIFIVALIALILALISIIAQVFGDYLGDPDPMAKQDFYAGDADPLSSSCLINCLNPTSPGYQVNHAFDSVKSLDKGTNISTTAEQEREAADDRPLGATKKHCDGGGWLGWLFC